MAIVRAGPNEYLLVGRKGVLENRGSAVTTFLRPGTIYVLVPSTKQEAAFEFTQETKDGVPLRFKGTFIYRVADPVAAAAMFDFSQGDGTTQITTLLTHVCYGELRHAVSHMTMVECIEQRKTTLSGVVAAALQATVHSDGAESKEWGIRIEASQVAQVFIVDPTLRQQLEAEVRNEIKLKADQSNMQAKEEFQLAELASETRIQEQKLAADQATLRREEEMEGARVARQRRDLTENFETEKQAGELEKERLHAKLAAEEDRLTVEGPIRLLASRRSAGSSPRNWSCDSSRTRSMPSISSAISFCRARSRRCVSRCCRSRTLRRSSRLPRACCTARTSPSTATEPRSSVSSAHSSASSHEPSSRRHPEPASLRPSPRMPNRWRPASGLVRSPAPCIRRR